MNDTIKWRRPYRQLALAAVCGIVLIGAAFLAAFFTASDQDLFSLAPMHADDPIPELDIFAPDQLFQFHATFYTVWATMLLTLPAFCTVWFIKRSMTAAGYWLAFWTVGLLAMLIHLYMAIGVLFEWSWPHVLRETTRVSIPIPDLVLTLWWGIDVALGWCSLHERRKSVHIQRILVHLALLFVFLMGFIKEGEIGLSRGIGVLAALSVAVSLVIWWKRRRRN